MKWQAPEWFFKINAALIVLIAVWFRFRGLDTIPGLNGDDAWLPAQMRSYFAGGTFTFFTPTHRPIAPTYFLAHWSFQLSSAASIWLLRLPTALASLGTVLAVYFLFRKHLSRSGVLILTLLTAALPVHIAYARSLGEISQIALMEALVFYFLFHGRLLWAAGFFLVGLSVHPSFIFLSPLLLTYAIWQTQGSLRVRLRSLGLLVAGSAAVLLWVALAFPYGWASVRARLVWNTSHFHELFNFFVGLPRLLSGALVYQNFAGPLTTQDLLISDLICYALLTLGLTAGLWIFLRRQKTSSLAFLTGLLFSLVGFYLLSGSLPFEPGTERIAYFLALPLTLALALSLENWAWGRWLVVALCWLALLSFEKNYFSAIARTGGSAHDTYRTGPVEPKLEAFRWILKDRESSRSPVSSVMVEDWWNFWPLTFFSFEQSSIKFYRINPDIVDPVWGHPSPPEKELKEILRRGGYLLGFSQGRMARKISRWTDIDVFRHDVRDFADRPVVSIWRLNSTAPSPN